ncbi:hypothetical protein [Streptococcus parasuis]|uniref:hypothetical protein n=1 Tax=Streptococcus parasuis TaxID=1501662 RepID=UPI00370DD0E1
MKVNDLAGKFIFTDPKQECLIQTHGKFEVIYKGRIEFLYNCDNPIEEYEVTNLEIGDHAEDGNSWISDILIITVKKVDEE